MTNFYAIQGRLTRRQVSTLRKAVRARKSLRVHTSLLITKQGRLIK